MQQARHTLYISAIATLFCLYFCASCTKEEGYAPNYRIDLAEVEVDPTGKIESFTTDDRTTFRLSHTHKVNYRDTLLRARVFFIPLAEEKAELKQIAPILAPHPIKLQAEKIKMDPITLQSIWRGGDYINLRLNILSGEPQAAHYWGFVDQGLRERTRYITLYHSQNGDPEYYTREVYLSCPLRQCNIQKGDSIAIKIQTRQGLIIKKFVY